MRFAAQVISWGSLVLLPAAPILFLMNRMPLDTAKQWMLAATVLWFVTAWIWMGRKHSSGQ